MARQECDYYGGVYSTSEVLTGDTWINGKPIYRRIYEVPASASTGAVRDVWIDTGLTNVLGDVVSIHGCLSTSVGSYRPTTVIPFADISTITAWSTQIEGVYINNNKEMIRIRVGSGVPILGGHVILEYTKL